MQALNRAAPSLRRQSRRLYATQSPASGTSGSPQPEQEMAERFADWALILSLAGAAGIGGYLYLQNNLKGRTPVEHVKSKVKQLAAEKDAGDQGPGVLGALLKDVWTPFKLESVEPYNHNSNIFHFSFPENSRGKATGIQAAGALLVKSPDGDNEVKDEKGKPVIRPYTPISSAEQTGSVDLLVKKYNDGKLTPYIFSMKPGDNLLFKGPILKYKYEPNVFDRGLCIAGGSGITPMYQMIAHSLNLPEDKTKWTLVFSNVTEDDILLRKEFDALAAKSDRLEIRYVVDKGSRAWKGEIGYITADMLSRLFPRQDDKVMAFICGPPPQVSSLAGPKDGPRQGELRGALSRDFAPAEVFKF